MEEGLAPKYSIKDQNLCLESMCRCPSNYEEFEERSIGETEKCPCYGREMESNVHSIICCEVAKRVWDCWDICVVEDGQELYDVPDIALQILDKRTTRELKCFLLLLGQFGIIET